MKRDIIYSISCLAFAIMIGGAVYEHLNVVPQWSAAPPVSLSMFQGEYGLNPELFWMSIHPVNIILFAAIKPYTWQQVDQEVLNGALCVWQKNVTIKRKPRRLVKNGKC